MLQDLSKVTQPGSGRANLNSPDTWPSAIPQFGAAFERIWAENVGMEVLHFDTTRELDCVPYLPPNTPPYL